MEKYVRVEIKTTEFDAEDVITTSNFRNKREEYETFDVVPVGPESLSGWW